MLKKVFDLLSSLRLTIVAGLFLVASLLLTVLQYSLVVDPAWVPVLICGYPLLYLAFDQLIHQRGIARISSDLLVSIAMLAALFIGEIFAAGEVALIMALGTILEEKAVERAQSGLHKLISLAPTTGRRINNGAIELINADQIEVGDLLRVLPGEAIPVDGQIIIGNTSIDQSTITGESLPIDKAPGDPVFSGTINRFGSIDIQATSVGADSSLQKLIRLVQEAEQNRAPLQRIVDRWAAWLVPIIVVIAVTVYLASADIIRAVTVLVVFCPCALVLATPTSIIAAIGQAARHGVIIKSGDALERLGRVDTFAFDKTGTLTHGKLTVSDVLVVAAGAESNAALRQGKVLLPAPDQLLALAAAVESHSEHPLGKAVVAEALAREIVIPIAHDFITLPGRGICATFGLEATDAATVVSGCDGATTPSAGSSWGTMTPFACSSDVAEPLVSSDYTATLFDGSISGMTVYCGSSNWLQELGLAIDTAVHEALATLREQGKATILVAVDASILGIIALSDQVREKASSSIQALHKTASSTLLLTGDNHQTAGYLAFMVGIEEVHSGLLPIEKAELINELQQSGRSICMVGDGVNDALALKTADVGVAMASIGSDIAIEAADIVLVGDDIGMIPYLKRLSNATVRLIKLNITISMVINVIAIILSVVGILNPISGALVHNVGSVLVVLNAALLYDRKFI